MRKLLIASLFLVLLYLPISVLAAGLGGISLSFGGRVAVIIPCSDGMIYTVIIPAGIFPVTYIWTPITKTSLVGPPSHLGQEILGTASTYPGVCFIGGGFLSSPIPLVGNYMLTVGTSAGV